MLPKTLCIVDDDREYTEFLGQYLRQQGVAVTTFLDSDDFLTSDGAFGFDFYLVDLMLPGVDGLDLIRLLRRRSEAGVVVVSGRPGSRCSTPCSRRAPPRTRPSRCVSSRSRWPSGRSGVAPASVRVRRRPGGSTARPRS